MYTYIYLYNEYTYTSKVRRLITPKGLVRGESPRDKGERRTYSVPNQVGGVLFIMVTRNHVSKEMVNQESKSKPRARE